MFEARIEADSLCMETGRRLTTIVATYPRIVHSEFMTHRDRARNAASSRAIPLSKMISAVQTNPFIPIKWGAEQKGMQTGDEIPETSHEEAKAAWLKSRDEAVEQALKLSALGVHKSICNRLLEPFAWITVVTTATEWKNFFRLRCHSDAEVHLRKIAEWMMYRLETTAPKIVSAGYLHLPFVQDIERSQFASVEDAKKVSAARCARVSYLTHEGKYDPDADIALFERLTQGSGFGHWSPMEHVAEASNDADLRSGPFIGWKQFRKEFPNENVQG